MVFDCNPKDKDKPMRLTLFRTLLLASFLFSAHGYAETLPLPQNLVGAASDDGEALLVGAEAREAYFPLASNFLTQKNQAFCGVASMVMVFNAMALPAPAVPEFDPYTTFTQDNVLDARTDAIITVETIMKQGITLDQLGALLAVQPVTVEVHHAADSSIESFRSKAKDHLSKPGQFVVINYLRKAIGQEKGGHISPLAAYNADTDRFLILDVARYKYPPVWVKTDELFAAMNTVDKDNADKTRGFILVAKK
jgi:Phytochelatin synthase